MEGSFLSPGALEKGSSGHKNPQSGMILYTLPSGHLLSPPTTSLAGANEWPRPPVIEHTKVGPPLRARTSLAPV